MDIFGGFYVVINFVGILCDKMFYKFDDVDWDVVFDVYFKGSYNVCKVIIEYFCNQEEG